MRITVTARHCEIPDELRVRARTLVARLAKVAPRPHHAQVVFFVDHGAPSVEVQLHRAGGVIHVGKTAAADHRSALDLAVAKVRRQLDKSLVRHPPTARRRRGAARSRVLEPEPR